MTATAPAVTAGARDGDCPTSRSALVSGRRSGPRTEPGQGHGDEPADRGLGGQAARGRERVQAVGGEFVHADVVPAARRRRDEPDRGAYSTEGTSDELHSHRYRHGCPADRSASRPFLQGRWRRAGRPRWIGGKAEALGGLAGLTVAIGFAVQPGEARGFFLPGIYVDAAYAIAFLASALIGRPLIGVAYGLLSGRRGQWRQDARLRRTLTRATVGWSLVFAVRAGAQAFLYLDDRPALLAASKLLLGWPLTVLALGLTFAAIGHTTRRA
jgi:hypothetical protein